MRYLVFQVIAFQAGIPSCEAIGNDPAPVMEKFNALEKDKGGGFERIEYWAKGIRRSKRTFHNGQSSVINIEEAAQKLIESRNPKKAQVVEQPVVEEQPVSPSSEGASGADTPDDQSKPEGDTSGAQGDVPGIDASPAAIMLAKEKGIDLTKVVGTGTNGKITKIDVEKLV